MNSDFLDEGWLVKSHEECVTITTFLEKANRRLTSLNPKQSESRKLSPISKKREVFGNHVWDTPSTQTEQTNSRRRLWNVVNWQCLRLRTLICGVNFVNFTLILFYSKEKKNPKNHLEIDWCDGFSRTMILDLSILSCNWWKLYPNQERWLNPWNS